MLSQWITKTSESKILTSVSCKCVCLQNVVVFFFWLDISSLDKLSHFNALELLLMHGGFGLCGWYYIPQICSLMCSE